MKKDKVYKINVTLDSCGDITQASCLVVLVLLVQAHLGLVNMSVLSAMHLKSFAE